jgi:regulator of RNase E activity RraA
MISTSDQDNKQHKFDDMLGRLKNLRTELIADAFAKLPNIEKRIINGVPPLDKTTKICGPAFTAVYTDITDSRDKLFQFNRFHIDKIPKNSVLVIENSGKLDLASVWGELVSLAAKARGVLGTITNGYVRDADQIELAKYPVFATGKAISNSNEYYKVVAIQTDVTIKGVAIRPGDIILADNSGIVVIAPNDLNRVVEFAEKKNLDESRITELIRKGKSLEEIHQLMTSPNNTTADNLPLFQKYKNNLSSLGLFAVATAVIGTACYIAKSPSFKSV